MRCSTRWRVSSLMSLWLRSAFETVINETPRSWAMSFIRTAMPFQSNALNVNGQVMDARDILWVRFVNLRPIVNRPARLWRYRRDSDSGRQGVQTMTVGV